MYKIFNILILFSFLVFTSSCCSFLQKHSKIELTINSIIIPKSKEIIIKNYSGKKSTDVKQKVPIKQETNNNQELNNTNNYGTLCKDGTYSGSSGRGSCSHHGGKSSTKRRK